MIIFIRIVNNIFLLFIVTTNSTFNIHINAQILKNSSNLSTIGNLSQSIEKQHENLDVVILLLICRKIDRRKRKIYTLCRHLNHYWLFRKSCPFNYILSHKTQLIIHRNKRWSNIITFLI